jgi:hypothetical protein
MRTIRVLATDWTSEGNVHEVAVRNLQDEIRVGDVFTGLQCRVDLAMDASQRDHVPLPIAVTLELTEVESYGKSLGFLSPGMTGRLTLRGEVPASASMSRGCPGGKGPCDRLLGVALT